MVVAYRLYIAELENRAINTDKLPKGSNEESNPTPSNEFAPIGDRFMDLQLMKACCEGDLDLLRHLIDLRGSNILLSVTPHGNTCLHLAAMLGHDEFARYIWSESSSLFSCTNEDGETPLIAALMASNAELASDMLTDASQLLVLESDLEEGRPPLSEMLLQMDKRAQNALHHAIRNGFEDLALKLIETMPRLSEVLQPPPLKEIAQRLSVDEELPLSEKVASQTLADTESQLPDPTLPKPRPLQANKILESPMVMAARKGYVNLVRKMLEIPTSADYGPCGSSVLHVSLDHPGHMLNLILRIV